MSHERRVFVTLHHNQVTGSEVSISDADAHHLRTVVRASPGDPILIVDSASGKEYESFVSSADSPFIVKLGNEVTAERRIGSVRTLLFALCKNKTNELVAEKATELGADHILFWEGERSIVRLKTQDERVKKTERLSKIAAESSKQSARNSIPRVYVAANLSEALEILDRLKEHEDRFFFGSLNPASLPFSRMSPLKSFAHVLIGPEGDLSPKEEDRLLKYGFEGFTLGSNRLRAETAAFAAIAAIDIFGEMSRGAK